MMSTTEHLNQLLVLSKCIRSAPDTPWWVVDMVRVLMDLVQENEDLRKDQDALLHRVTSLEQACTHLETRYSELLYKLKSGD